MVGTVGMTGTAAMTANEVRMAKAVPIYYFFAQRWGAPAGGQGRPA